MDAFFPVPLDKVVVVGPERLLPLPIIRHRNHSSHQEEWFFIPMPVVNGLGLELVSFQENPGWIGWKLERDLFGILNGQVGGSRMV